MFTKILVVTDPTADSLEVVKSLTGLRAFGTRECVLFHCFSIPQVIAFPDEMVEHYKRMLDKQKQILERQGFHVTMRVVPGLIEHEMPRVAIEEGATVLVVAAYEHTLTSELIGGSGFACVAMYHATVPVLVLRLTKGEDDRTLCVTGKNGYLEHVLYPTDFSDNAEYAFTHLEKAVQSGAGEVTLLHVQDKTKMDSHLKDRLEEFQEIDKERLERMKARLEKLGSAQVHIELPYGIPKAEVIDRAQSGVSLVIMGSHGRGFVRELFLGSVSHNVARHAKAPVLFVPWHREKAEQPIE
jgi:nucleotide-binding universal stress UspA family protein